MIILIQISGIIMLLISILHCGCPRYFNWKISLSKLDLLHRQIYIVHTFFIGLIVFLMGILCISLPTELQNTQLGKYISFGFGIFWFIRLIFQHFVYSSQPWKGQRFQTVMHIIFSVLWLFLSFVFMLNFLKFKSTKFET